MRRHALIMVAAILGFLNADVIGPAHPASGDTGNHIDADTQTLESGSGRWSAWYSATAERSTAQARTGAASLSIAVTAPYGWGVHLDNHPGFPAAPGAARIGFWTLQQHGASSSVTLRATWRDRDGADLASNAVSVASTTTSWQEATAEVVAPPGTTTVWLSLVGNADVHGAELFVDDVVVGSGSLPPDAEGPTTVPSAPPPGSAAPTSPPAALCGSPLLYGPEIQPAGSVRVEPGEDLGAATLAHPPGTTFWLTPGTHTLGTSEFGQVIPKDNNTYVGAPGAILDGQHVNNFAFTQHATGVTIEHLTIQNFGVPGGNHDSGVVNHDAAAGWRIQYNTIRNNSGAGVFIGSDNVVRYNCITENGQYGFSMYRPPVPGDSAIKNIVFDHNEVSRNHTDGWEWRWKETNGESAGCGCSGGGKFWDVNGATVTHNWVHHNNGVGLWADMNNIAFRFEGNYINDNHNEAIFYEVSYNALIANNTFERNGIVKGQDFAARGDPFPVGAIYLSESGGDPRVSSQYATLEIAGNVFRDNWSGVVLWENADRFCNLFVGGAYCTRGGTGTLRFCAPPTIWSEPYLSDCRWKTQNVFVHNNHFSIDKAVLPGCPGAVSCGKQALFSNWGTWPEWSPYQARTVQDAITFKQNNVFAGNSYVGDWAFMAYDTANVVNFDQWRGAPYGQDGTSTLQR